MQSQITQFFNKQSPQQIEKLRYQQEQEIFKQQQQKQKEQEQQQQQEKLNNELILNKKDYIQLRAKHQNKNEEIKKILQKDQKLFTTQRSKQQLEKKQKLLLEQKQQEEEEEKKKLIKKQIKKQKLKQKVIDKVISQKLKNNNNNQNNFTLKKEYSDSNNDQENDGNKQNIQSQIERKRRGKKPKSQIQQENQEEEYEVDRIINHYYDKKTNEVLYEIKWVNYSLQETTWEPEQCLQGSKQLIRGYKMKVSEPVYEDSDNWGEDLIMDGIVSYLIHKDVKYYLIKWETLMEEANSWITEKYACQKDILMVKDFEEKVKRNNLPERFSFQRHITTRGTFVRHEPNSVKDIRFDKNVGDYEYLFIFNAKKGFPVPDDIKLFKQKYYNITNFKKPGFNFTLNYNPFKENKQIQNQQFEEDIEEDEFKIKDY